MLRVTKRDGAQIKVRGKKNEYESARDWLGLRCQGCDLKDKACGDIPCTASQTGTPDGVVYYVVGE